MVTTLLMIVSCRDSKVSEDEEAAYDCPVQLEENPAYSTIDRKY